MDITEIKETEIWRLYEKGRDYHRMTGIYTDTDRNYRMYNGNQWEGAKIGEIEPLQENVIKPIVKYKIAVIHDNLYAVNYSSLNFENTAFRAESERYCKLLNRYAANLWERDKLDFKMRRVTKDSAINDEGIIYVNFDNDSKLPINEIVKKNDVYYGNENDDDIQNQPYILIRKRLPVVNAVDLARSLGLSADKEQYIIGDNDNFDESGEAAKQEIDPMVTIVYKMYKQEGTVHFSAASKYVTITEDNDTGLKLYPVAHFIWEEKEGSSRGEGEVRHLVPNQIEINRTLMRRALAVKLQAFPTKVVDVSKIVNPTALNTVGGTIRTNGAPVDDVHKIIGTIPPAQMSTDVKELQSELINLTRELAGAGETATGQVNPETASGRAILAVQQAAQQPITEQRESFKNFVEDLSRIWLDYLIAYSAEGINMEEEITDPNTGNKQVVIVKVPQSALIALKATVKIDVTPKSVYDKFAQEQTLENLLTGGWFSPQRIGELEAYADALDDDSVAPKLKIKSIIDKIKQNQQRIAAMNARAQIMQQRASMFLSSDPDEQASMMADAVRQMQGRAVMPDSQRTEPEKVQLEANETINV